MKGWERKWKRQEPEGRLNEKQKALQMKSRLERTEMEINSTQRVKIIFYRELWGVPKYFKAVGLEFSIPLTMEEIQSRIQDAFPKAVMLE